MERISGITSAAPRAFAKAISFANVELISTKAYSIRAGLSTFQEMTGHTTLALSEAVDVLKIFSLLNFKTSIADIRSDAKVAQEAVKARDYKLTALMGVQLAAPALVIALSTRNIISGVLGLSGAGFDVLDISLLFYLYKIPQAALALYKVKKAKEFLKRPKSLEGKYLEFAVGAKGAKMVQEGNLEGAKREAERTIKNGQLTVAISLLFLSQGIASYMGIKGPAALFLTGAVALSLGQVVFNLHQDKKELKRIQSDA